MLKKVISGGQTGSDMAGLLAGKAVGLETGGFVPSGWKTEKGPNPRLALFGLIETKSSDYQERTELNIRNSDATLIVSRDHNSPGTKLTQKLVDKHKKKIGCVTYVDTSLDTDVVAERLAEWILYQKIQVLNIAGNRESKAPGIQVWLTLVLIGAFSLVLVGNQYE
jgi:hypothetical protein